MCISSKLSLPQCLNYDKNFYMLYRLTLMFTPINLYDNVINCNENIPAPKHVFDPIMNINLLLCLYNYLFITTIALFTPTHDTDKI
jgi:hypothetical protein